MTQEPPDREALRTEYHATHPSYEKLEKSLERDLTTLLDEAGINVLSIESRIKKFDSFWSKTQLEHYNNPLEEVKDICGLRIICYYPSDLEPVCEVLDDGFEVIEYEDKADSMEADKFGYLSRHVIVTPQRHRLRTRNYRGLDGLKAEIQVRTIFQHAWAELSKELAYKKKEDVPSLLQRRLSRLSAMLENADEEFDELHTAKVDYGRSVSQEAESGQLDVSLELNIDSLAALLDFRFSASVRNAELTSHLLGVLNSLDMSMGELLKALDTVDHFLPGVQAQLVKELGGWYGTRPAMVLTALALTNDQYWQESLPHMNRGEIRIIDGWRASLSEIRRSETRNRNGQTRDR